MEVTKEKTADLVSGCEIDREVKKTIQPDMSSGSILVIDDDLETCDYLTNILSRHQYAVQTYTCAIKALEALEARHITGVDLILCDFKMPKMTGLDLVRRAKETMPQVPVILITAFGSIETAIDAIREGAHDYVLKPLNIEHLRVTIDRAIKYKNLQIDNVTLRKELHRSLAKSWSMDEIIGKSAAMQSIFSLINRVSQSNANVLINGESGTGKEMVAHSIHKKSPRAEKPFTAINCSAIPEALLESELFGHAKGAFTGATHCRRGLFEDAKGGTVFLDEIGDMPVALQAKLLRVLQERKIKPVGSNEYIDIDVRIIAATHKNLLAEIKTGGFREDLYYRLSVIPLALPPLRDRREDIPILVDFFLKKHALTNGSKLFSITKSAMASLIKLPWNGNVRELENVIERAIALCPGDIIEEKDLMLSAPNTMEGASNSVLDLLCDNSPTLDELEAQYIRRVLETTGGQKDKAAQILGIDRKTLYRKLAVLKGNC